jgi:PAS domain S-box-containing protein
MHPRQPLNSLLARLLVGSGIPLLLFLAVALVSWLMFGRLLTALGWEKHTHQVISQAQMRQEKLDRMRLAGLALRVLPPENRDPLADSYRHNRDEFHALGDELARGTKDNPGQQARLKRIDQLADDWEALVNSELGPLPDRPPRAELERQAMAFFLQTDTLLKDLQTELDQFIKSEEDLLARRRTQTTWEIWQTSLVIGGAVLAAVVLTVLVMLQSARGVTRPINALGKAARELIAGRFRSVPPSGPDEIAQLIVHFNHMAMTLTEKTSDLQEQEERYRTYVGSVAHILWTANAAGEVVDDLPLWREYTGQSREEISGAGWLDAVHPDDRELVRQTWQEAVAERKAYDCEYRLRSHQGTYRHFAARGVPVMTSDGQVREWIGTCTDITERKQEAELLGAKEAAEATSRAKSAFLAKMSHELRTPLNAVIGMSRMLATQRFGPLTLKQADYIKDITQAGEHLLVLINDILDLEKVESGKLEVQPEVLPAQSAMQALVSTLRPLADARRVVLRLEAPAEDGALSTDPARFRQILYNLLSNAIKFTPGPGRVTIRWEWVERAERTAPAAPPATAQAIRVAVSDTGVGIAPGDQEAIWEEFRQLPSPHGGAKEGTGLGLALTRRLVRLLGGTIWVDSQPGQGSTFTFVLPRSLPTEELPADERDGAPEEGHPLVLIVEDHPSTHKLLVDWLRGAGLATASAFDGATGLALARERRPQLVVLDLHLPRLDGWQVLQELKSDQATADIPVVIVTISAAAQGLSRLPVQAFFVKPVEGDTFVGRLRELGLVPTG